MTIRRRLRGAMREAAAAAVWRAWDAAASVASIAPTTRRGAQFYAMGEGSLIVFPIAALFGEDRIQIGAGTAIGPYSSISAGLFGQPPRPAGEPPRLVIGERCVIGRGATITAHEQIHIGDDVWTGNDVFISDQNHGWEDLSIPIGAQAQLPQPVSIGDGAWLGKGCAILPGATVGKRAIVGAGAVVTGEVPDFAIVGGVPARVIKHFAPGRGWVSAKDESPDGPTVASRREGRLPH